MTDSFAAPSCSIELYPFEGGTYTLQGGQIQSAVVRKSLYDGSVGTFEISLAPGGPQGPESLASWSEVITPMSHALIGMSRGDDAAVVLDGVVTNPGETQTWRTSSRGSFATRGQGFSGGDFAWFFRTFNYYALTFYGLTAGTPLGGNLSLLPGPFAQYINAGLLGGTSSSDSNPVQVGRTWFRNIMGGEHGILGHTYIPYQNGSRKAFFETVGANWENYPDVYIPYGDFFMTHEESWMEKFLGIFPFPWYEFFVTTAAATDYARVSSATGIDDVGTRFGMDSIPNAPRAGPLIVARVNPCPQFKVLPVGSGGTTNIGSMDVTRWNALPLYDLTKQPYSFTRMSIGFSAEDARNFYQLNPSGWSTILTGNNSGNNSAPLTFVAAADAASIQRYGFRPRIGNTRWLFDPQGLAAQAGANILDTIAFLTGALIGWHHPTPLMAAGDITLPLTPSILIGTRFRFAPFKTDPKTWDFYVVAVEHRFEFGGNSSTRLTLARGLPTEVYADTADGGLLRAIYTGNAMRKDGIYVVGLPTNSAPPLQFINTPEQAQQLNQTLYDGFISPQAPVQ